MQNEPVSLPAGAPLAGHKLYCWTVTGTLVDGIGVSDPSGYVTVILKADHPTFSCSVRDSADKVIATLLFSDSLGKKSQKISGSGDIPLGTITVYPSSGTATATIPPNATIETGGCDECNIPKDGMFPLSYVSDCPANGINLTDLLGTSNIVEVGARFRATGTYNIGPQSADSMLIIANWGTSDFCPQRNIASGAGSFDILEKVTSVMGDNKVLQIKVCLPNVSCNDLCEITLGTGGP